MHSFHVIFTLCRDQTDEIGEFLVQTMLHPGQNSLFDLLRILKSDLQQIFGDVPHAAMNVRPEQSHQHPASVKAHKMRVFWTFHVFASRWDLIHLGSWSLSKRDPKLWPECSNHSSSPVEVQQQLQRVQHVNFSSMMAFLCINDKMNFVF